MKLYRNDNDWTRAERNKTNENWNRIENNYNNVVENVSDEAFQLVVDSAKLIWKPQVETYSDIATTYPNPEEGWAVYVKDEGNVYRYDGSNWVKIQNIEPGPYNEIESKLEETSNKFDNTFDIRSYDYEQKPLFCFQFDDAQITDWTRFKNIFESEGVPGNICVITSKMGTDDNVWMNAEQIIALKNLGWGVYSHSHTHPRLGDITNESELDYELKTSKEILKSIGIDTDVIVYPYGSTSDLVIKVARKYYQYGIDISRGKPVYPPYIENMLVSRVRGLSSNATIEECKQQVDNAFLTGNFTIFTDHSQYEYYDDPNNLEKLRELIQYIKSKGGEIVTTLEGLRRKANIIDVGGVRNYFRLTRNGEIASSESVYKMYIGLDDLTNDTPIDYFRVGSVTEYRIDNNRAQNGGFPEGIGGTLIVHRHTSDTYAYQMYHIYNSNRIYKRRWNNAVKQWGEWLNIDAFWIISEDNAYTISNPLTDFQPDKVTSTKLTDQTILSGFPEQPPSAVLETHRFGVYENFQYFKANDKNYYRRWLNGSNAWDIWKIKNENLNMYDPDSLPPANSGNRGRMIFVYRGASGEEDEIKVCMRTSDGSFKWRTVNVT